LLSAVLLYAYDLDTYTVWVYTVRKTYTM